jgi:hypothetical protein
MAAAGSSSNPQRKPDQQRRPSPAERREAEGIARLERAHEQARRPAERKPSPAQLAEAAGWARLAAAHAKALVPRR